MAYPYDNNPNAPTDHYPALRRRGLGDVNDAPVQTVDPYKGNWLAETARSTAADMENNITAGVPLLYHKLTGNQAGVDENIQQYQAQDARARALGPEIQSFDDAERAGGGLWNYAKALGYQGAAFVPDTAAALLSGGTAGAASLATKQAVKGIARRVATNAIENNAENQARRELMESTVRRQFGGKVEDAVSDAVRQAVGIENKYIRREAMAQVAAQAGRTPRALDKLPAVGTRVGMAAGYFPSALGESVELLSDPNTTQGDAAVLGAGAAVGAALNLLPMERVFNRIGSDAAEQTVRKFLPRVGSEMAKQGFLEAGQEVAQTATTLASHAIVKEDPTVLFDEKAREQYLMSALAGGIFGAGMGGGVEVSRSAAHGIKDVTGKVYNSVRDYVRDGLHRLAERQRARREALAADRAPMAESAEAEGKPKAGGISGVSESLATRFNDIKTRMKDAYTQGRDTASGEIETLFNDQLDEKRRNDMAERVAARIDNGEPLHILRPARALEANPVAMDTPLQSHLMTFLRDDSPVWQQPEAARELGRLLENIAQGESLDDDQLAIVGELGRMGDFDREALAELVMGYDNRVKLNSMGAAPAETLSNLHRDLSPGEAAEFEAQQRAQPIDPDDVDISAAASGDTVNGGLTERSTGGAGQDPLGRLTPAEQMLSARREFEFPYTTRNRAATGALKRTEHIKNPRKREAVLDEKIADITEAIEAATAERRSAAAVKGLAAREDLLRDIYGPTDQKYKYGKKVITAPVSPSGKPVLRSEAMKKAWDFFNKRAKQPDTIRLENGARPGDTEGVTLHDARLLDIGGLFLKKIAEIKDYFDTNKASERGKQRSTALTMVFGDLYLAGIKADPASINHGKMEFSQGQDKWSYYVKEAEAENLRAILRGEREPARLSRRTPTIGPIDRKADATRKETAEQREKALEREPLQPTIHGHVRVGRGYEGQGQMYDETDGSGGDFDDSGDFKQGARKTPEGSKNLRESDNDPRPYIPTEGVVTDVDFTNNPYEALLNKIRRARADKTLTPRQRGQVLRNVGVEIGRTELAKELENETINPKRYAAEIKRLEDFDTGLARQYAKRALRGEFSPPYVTERRAVTEKTNAIDQAENAKERSMYGVSDGDHAKRKPARSERKTLTVAKKARDKTAELRRERDEDLKELRDAREEELNVVSGAEKGSVYNKYREKAAAVSEKYAKRIEKIENAAIERFESRMKRIEHVRQRMVDKGFDDIADAFRLQLSALRTALVRLKDAFKNDRASDYAERSNYAARREADKRKAESASKEKARLGEAVKKAIASDGQEVVDRAIAKREKDLAAEEEAAANRLEDPDDRHATYNRDFTSYTTRNSASYKKAEEIRKAEAELLKHLDPYAPTPVITPAMRRIIEQHMNADGTFKDTWLKAPNGKDTELSPLQWVMVRTREFKEWFGHDWEKRARADVSASTGSGVAGSARDVRVHASKSDGPIRRRVGDAAVSGHAGADAGTRGVGAQDLYTPDGRLRAGAGRRGTPAAINARTGEPQVFYHGTYGQFSKFDVNHPGKKDNGWMGRGIYISTNIEFAHGYRYNKKHKQNDGLWRLIPLFIRAENLKPWTHAQKTANSGIEADQAVLLTAKQRMEGYDGAYVDYGQKGFEVAVFAPVDVKHASANQGGFNESDNIFQDRLEETKQAYERRIDALFTGAEPAAEGVRILDRSDIIGLVAGKERPLVLDERKLKLGQTNHPNITAAMWKKIPEWLDNPAAVFLSDTQGVKPEANTRLVVVAPESYKGMPVLVIVETDPKKKDGGSMPVDLLVTAYDAGGKVPDIFRWRDDGLLRYADKEKLLAVLKDSPMRRLPDTSYFQNKPGAREKILTEKNLAGYRRNRAPLPQRDDLLSGKATHDPVAERILKQGKFDKPTDGSNDEADLKLFNDLATELLMEAGFDDPVRVEALDTSDLRNGGDYSPKNLRIRLNMRLPGPERMESFLHELGHHIVHATVAKHVGWKTVRNFDLEGSINALRHHEPELHAALEKDFKDWQAKHGNLSPAPFFRGKRGERRIDDHTRAFHEWLADNIARAMQMQKKPVSIVGKFFDSIATAFRRVWRAVKGTDYAPAKSVDAWVRSMFSPESRASREVFGHKLPDKTIDKVVKAAGRLRVDDTRAKGVSDEALTALKEAFGGIYHYQLPAEARAVLDKVLARPFAVRELKNTVAHSYAAGVKTLENNVANIYQALEATKDAEDTDIKTLRAELEALKTENEAALSQMKRNKDTTLRNIDHPTKGAETRAAVALELYVSGQLETQGLRSKAAEKLGLTKEKSKVANIFSGFMDDVWETYGIASDGARARRILDDILEGVVQQHHRDKLIYDVRQRETNSGSTRQKWADEIHKLYEKLAEPASRLFMSGQHRLYNSGINGLREIATALHRPWNTVAEADGDDGLTPALTHETALWQRRTVKALDGLDEAGQREVMRLMAMQMNPEAAGWSEVPKVQRDAIDKLRKLYEDAHEYAVDAGVNLPHRALYHPVMFNVTTDADAERLTALYSQPRYEQAIRKVFSFQAEDGKWVPSQEPMEKLVERLVNGVREGAHDGAYSEDPVKDGKRGEPEFRAANYRISNFVYHDLRMREAAYSKSQSDKNKAELDQARANVAEFAALQQHDPAVVFGRYFDALVRHAEYTRRFGGGDNNRAKLDAMLERAKHQGATPRQLQEAEHQVRAALGVYGENGSPVLEAYLPSLNDKIKGPRTRRILQGVQAYQNLRLLPLAALSSLVDPMGIAMRTGGDFNTAWMGFKRGFKSLFNKQSAAELDQMLEALGATDDMLTIRNLYGGGDPDSFAGKVNNFVFKWNGMQTLVHTTRRMAVAAGHGFLIRHSEAMDKDAKSRRYMNELKLQPGDVQTVEVDTLNGKVRQVKLLSDEERAAASAEERARDDRVRQALRRFVDEAILRPHSMQVPLWHNDPYMGIVTQYKAFGYAMWDQIGGRFAHEMRNMNPAVLLAALAYLPIILMAELLRELIQYGTEGNPRRENWGADDYLMLSAERSGLVPNQYRAAFDLIGDVKGGSIPGASQAGPTLNQIGYAKDAFIDHERSKAQAFENALPGSAMWKHRFNPTES